MSMPYVGEIRLFAGNFAPNGWFFCNGQLLPLSEYDTLFQLIGTTYGGDGQSTFQVPDLRGRVPVHTGSLGGVTYTLAETGGVEEVTLSPQQIPAHTHALQASTDSGDHDRPAGAVLGTAPSLRALSTSTPDVANAALAPASIGTVGGSQPHTNLQPYLGISYIISAFGVYPSQI
jgi:microcystin-dependent protein